MSDTKANPFAEVWGEVDRWRSANERKLVPASERRDDAKETKRREKAWKAALALAKARVKAGLPVDVTEHEDGRWVFGADTDATEPTSKAA